MDLRVATKRRQMGGAGVFLTTVVVTALAVVLAIYTADHWYDEFAQDFLPPIIQRQINPHFKKTSGFTSVNFREVVHKEVRAPRPCTWVTMRRRVSCGVRVHCRRSRPGPRLLGQEAVQLGLAISRDEVRHQRVF